MGLSLRSRRSLGRVGIKSGEAIFFLLCNGIAASSRFHRDSPVRDEVGTMTGLPRGCASCNDAICWRLSQKK